MRSAKKKRIELAGILREGGDISWKQLNVRPDRGYLQASKDAGGRPERNEKRQVD